MKNKLYIISLLLMMILAVGALAYDSRCEGDNEIYVEDYGCVQPKVSFDTAVKAGSDKQSTASSISSVEPIVVSSPWAAQGQPVIISFTLENIGDQYPYPYNEIALPPNSYVLTLSADKDIGVRDKDDGTFVDIWSTMSFVEKFSYTTCTMTSSFAEYAGKALQGRVCGYVDSSKCLSKKTLDYVEQVTGNRSLYSWECIKIVDLPYFSESLKSYCPDKIDSSCLSKINKNFGNSVSSSVIVLLTDTEGGKIPKGTCIRPTNANGFFGLVGKLTLSAFPWNLVKCSIGDDGIKPGEKVTFQFVGLIPSDAPVINPKDVASLEGYDLDQGSSGYTYSTSCKSDQNADACHSIYAAVYPAQTKTMLTMLGDSAGNLITVGSCSISGLFKLSASAVVNCVNTKGYGAVGVGSPIWEGSGVYYIVGAVLKGSITLLLWAAAVAGGLSGLLLKNK